MIEANACADAQVSEMEIVLHESGVFAIMARIVERKIQRSGGIEDRLAIDFSLSKRIETDYDHCSWTRPSTERMV